MEVRYIRFEGQCGQVRHVQDAGDSRWIRITEYSKCAAYGNVKQVVGAQFTVLERRIEIRLPWTNMTWSQAHSLVRRLLIMEVVTELRKPR
jgi:hypothetical protein